MPKCPLKPAIEKNTQDIQALTKSLVELSTSVRLLAEGQKDLGDLVRLQVEHNVEIKSLKYNLGELNTVLNKTNRRIEVLETYQLTMQASHKARSSLIQKIVEYSPILITGLGAVVTASVIIAMKELS